MTDKKSMNADEVLEAIETGASLQTVTTIGGNESIHKGNMSSELDADTLQGKQPVDISHAIGANGRVRGVPRERLGLVLWHPGDGAVSGDIDDWSGTQDESRLNGVTTVSGKYGDALDFQASNGDFIGTNLFYAASTASRTHGLTVTFWLNEDGAGDSGGRYASTDISDWWGFIESSGSVQMHLRDSSNTNYTTSGNFTSGTWEHWAGVFDPSVPEIRLYRDGSLTGSAAMSNANMGTGFVDRYLTLGCGSESSSFNTSQSGTFRDFQMDDFRVYHRTLSQSTIQDIMNNNV